MSKYNKKTAESKPKKQFTKKEKGSEDVEGKLPFEDDRYFCLNEKTARYCSLSEFKGNQYLNIREY